MLRPELLLMTEIGMNGTAGRTSIGSAIQPVAERPSFLIRRAEQRDLTGIEKLLTESKLPTAGVAESLEHFIVATDNDALLGAIGLEVFGDTALLRSAVVDRGVRSTGLGSRLVLRILALASEVSVRDLYLLTTTAENYFPRFGFVRTTRDAVPERIRGSVEFQGACPASAIVMVAAVERPGTTLQQPGRRA